MNTPREIPTRIVESAAAWCTTYRHPLGWASPFGQHPICATCHPPAVPSLVVEWLLRNPATVERPTIPPPDVPRPHALLTERADVVRRDRAARSYLRQLRENAPAI